MTVTEESSDTIQQQFQEFHERNPWVYDRLVALARQLVSNGATRLGIGMLWEVLRWQYLLSTTDPNSDFKLNDHYRSRYVRLIRQQEADLAARFELRKLRSP